MKKLLLSLGVAALAVSANAQVYVVGAGEGLTWDLPGTAVQAKSENVYEFTVENLSKFKVSTANTNDWDTYNATAYATGNTEFSASKVSKAGGETLPVEIWGEDQMVPYPGVYTITLDLNNMTMTAYTPNPEPTEAPDVFVRGDMNGWGSPDQWKFNYNTTDDMYWFVAQAETTINAGVNFKFADANWGSINYSANSAITVNPTGVTKVDMLYNKENQYLNADFTGIIYLKVLSSTTTYALFQPGVFEYDATAGVAGAVVEEGAPVFYNLQGQKVANPDRGIFVKVVGGKASKVIL